MNIRPLNDRILVQRLPSLAETGLIVRPEIAQEASTRWMVLAVGPGKRNKRGERVPCDVKAGDTVALGPYNDFEEGTLALFQQDDIRYVEEV